MISSQGLTLIELLVALVILVVGVLMAATMQTSALRASRLATVVQRVTKLAEAEIALRRQFDLSTTEGKSPTCKSTVPAGGYTCTVDVRACQLSGTSLSCPTTGVATANRIADQLAVTVAGPLDNTLTLRTVVEAR